MRTHRFAKALLLLAAGFLVSVGAQAQFVPLSRCHGAFPCSIPFAVDYRPDPMIAGQYGNTVSHVPLVVSVPMKLPIRPELQRSVATPLGAALEDAIHRTLQSGRPPSGDGHPGTAGSATASPPPADLEKPQPQR
ncbi:MAG TPA: hypothetical protein VKE50_06420 [Thermoanaerobaculia bacterium]|nr:hypothetical protein [Thermoanaerobaculia bacterium]